jgi:hypothetical protein
VEGAEYVFGDHCPVIVTLACKSQNTAVTRQMRDWKGYSLDRLRTELEKQSWIINTEDVQDYNDEFEQRLMSIIDRLAPFVQKRIIGNGFSESQRITRLKRKRKNVFNSAKRRNNVQLFKRSLELGKEIRREIDSSRRAKIREKVLSGGQPGLWKGLDLALDKGVDQIPKEIMWGNRIEADSGKKAQMFAEFFNTKIKTIVEQNVVQEGVRSGNRVMDAGEANYITLEKTENIMKNLKLKNSYGCDRIPL